jgi:arabinogalactan oligomer / maltooligosaccharide transport system permease protein
MDKIEKKPLISNKAKRGISTILGYLTLIVMSVVWIYPILWIVLSAFRNEYNDLGQLRGIVVSHYFPKQIGLENFNLLFNTTLFTTWFTNTLFVASITFVISTFMVLSVAYVMSKLKFKSRKLILNVALILGLFPGFMSIIAVYYILKFMNLTQSLFALILVYSAGSGLGFYIAKGFFDLIPKNLLESAKLDGATNFQSFMKIILPLSKPIIIYTALMSFSGPWMDFIFARVIIGETNPESWTVAVGLYMMLFGSQATADPNRFTMFAAGSILVAIPIVILFITMQRYYVEGVTAGAVKG